MIRYSVGSLAGAIALVALAAPVNLRAQWLSPQVAPVAVAPIAMPTTYDAIPPVSSPPMNIPDRRDYRWEGAAAGFLLFGGFTAWLASGLCDHNCAWPVVGSALAGGFMGFVLGGAITKSPGATTTGSSP